MQVEKNRVSAPIDVEVRDVSSIFSYQINMKLIVIRFTESLLEYGPTDKIVTQTKLTIPADKQRPIQAESTIESIPNVLPTPSTSSSDENAVEYFATPLKAKSSSSANEFFKTPTPMRSQLYSNKKFYTPSAPSLDDLDHIKEQTDVYATVKKKTATISTRPHNFTSKTFLKPDTCGCCDKKIRFGSVAAKCTECRTSVHQDCREKFTTSCLPQSATPIASKTGNQMGIIGDYTPRLAPMVPALIVHCVNEIETRGLNEVGLYRISGSDRDVKALKEKFLRNNGIPNLTEIDVHVLCGCVKDFLRSLRERLIPLSLWSTFSNASQMIPDDNAGNVHREVYRAVEMLPQPNRDTLAYLIMHFQRISECPEVKMPLTNFAKIFGPTIVGYSCPEPDQHMMFAETQIQYSVMFELLKIPTEYWNRFISLDQPTKQEERRELETYGSKFYSGTPSMKVARKERKFYNTPPYSAISKKKK
jgi:Rac GTPase-activating protein 1